MKNLKKEYEKVLSKVEKPSRYSGGEYNSVKNFTGKTSFCLCFPDVYEVAISNLGNKIIYSYLNSLQDYSCERAYAPWSDLAKELKERDLPLFSLDTRTPLNEFDALGFSLSYEMSYTNMLLMLDLSKLPLLSSDRGEEYPIVFAGGVCALNPEPFYNVVDFVVSGEGEVNLTPVLDLISEYKTLKKTKEELLTEIDQLPFAYVPSLHQEIIENGEFKGLTTNPKMVKAIAKDFENAFFPVKQLVPNIQAVHDRAVLELFRGCPRGCRFCQAGFTYRPLRLRSVDTLIKQAVELIENTGFDEISLNSLSTGDYPKIEELIKKLSPEMKRRGVKLSLPSLRLDSFASDKTEGVKKTGSLTFAPEAGSQRLRNVINKNISEADFVGAMKEAFSAGYRSVKLYFMCGLPTETEEDLRGIFEMCKEVKSIYREVTGRRDVSISASVANFVPKPFTPFQYEAQDSAEELDRKHEFLRGLFYKSGFRLSYHDTFTSKLEGLFALGGRKAANVLLDAYKLGATFDGWTDCFNREAWSNALIKNNVDLNEATKGFDLSDTLPWYYSSVGVNEEFYKSENIKAKSAVLTGGCEEKCLNCGSMKLGECKKCW